MDRAERSVAGIDPHAGPALAELHQNGGAQLAAQPYDLTRRERDVLRLLCERLSDREIAQRLIISSRTVQCHVASIRSKLGAATRREAATTATDLGLV
jgi:DNA-binding NarL/FixJ family response regulator